MGTIGSIWGWRGWNAIVALSTTGLLVGLVIALRQLGESRRATQLPAIIDLLREYRRHEMRMARWRVGRLKPCDPDHGLDQLDAEDREAVELLTHFLDNVGLLVRNDLLAVKPVATFLGLSALGVWENVEPYIRAERRVVSHAKPRRLTYQRHFEDLVARFDRAKIIADIEHLKTMPSSTD